MAAKPERAFKIVADNRKARFNYEIGEVIEAGIALMGSEVKSLRQGKANIGEPTRRRATASCGCSMPISPSTSRPAASTMRPSGARKLLLHKRQINKLIGAVEREGMTVVPLKLYFNEKGRAKIEIALARGKKLHDKRETEKKRSGIASAAASCARRDSDVLQMNDPQPFPTAGRTATSAWGDGPSSQSRSQAIAFL